MKTSLNPDIGIVNVLKNTFLSTRRNLVIILLHETYTNLDRLAVQFLLQARETAPSCPKPPYIPCQNLVLGVPYIYMYIYRRDKDRGNSFFQKFLYPWDGGVVEEGFFHLKNLRYPPTLGCWLYTHKGNLSRTLKQPWGLRGN